MKKIPILLLVSFIVLNGCKNQAKLDFDLCKAIHKVDYQKIEDLLNQGADPNVQDTDGDAILCKAIFLYMPEEKDERLKIVKLLLKQGANPNSRADLIYKGTTALMCAVTSDNSTDIVKLLLDKGADVNAKNDVGQTAINSAAWNGKIGIVKMLLDKGADKKQMNDEGMSPFMGACYRDHFEVVKLLFDPNSDLNIKDKDGFTALMLVALSPSPQIADWLLKKGADVNAKNKKGKTALDIAIEKDHKEVIKIINKYKKSQQVKL